jgi:hypothetical protein
MKPSSLGQGPAAMTERLPEAIQNELARRVDWRFLLEREDEPRTVCFAGGRLARALALVSAAVVDPESDPTGEDLAVLVNPRARSVRAAFRGLRPGGEVYMERYFPTVRGPHRSRRLLEAAGFTDVRCYWPWPRPDQGAPQFWLPLDAPAAATFFLGRSNDARRSLRGRLLRVLWRCAARLGILVPICSVARVPTAPNGGASLAATPSQPRLSWLLLTGGKRSVNKVVGLGFGDDDVRPTFAVKFARSASEEDGLRREARTLVALEECRPQLAGVPRVVFLERRVGRLALGETALEGRPSEDLTQRRFAELAESVTDWLVELAHGARPEPRGEWWHRLVEVPLARFERSFADVVERGEIVDTRDALSSLPDLPFVCEHRDCSPWNVLVDDRGEIALADWESSEPSGLPALDLVYFLTYGSFLVEGALESGTTIDAYERSLDPRTPTGAVVAECERSYCQRLGLHPTALQPLRLLCWIIHAASEYRRLEFDQAGPPETLALRGAVFPGLWRHELHLIRTAQAS